LVINFQSRVRLEMIRRIVQTTITLPQMNRVILYIKCCKNHTNIQTKL